MTALNGRILSRRPRLYQSCSAIEEKKERYINNILSPSVSSVECKKKSESLYWSTKHRENYSFSLLPTGMGQSVPSLQTSKRRYKIDCRRRPIWRRWISSIKTAILRALNILKSPTRPYAGLCNEPADGHVLVCITYWRMAIFCCLYQFKCPH